MKLHLASDDAVNILPHTMHLDIATENHEPNLRPQQGCCHEPRVPNDGRDRTSNSVDTHSTGHRMMSATSLMNSCA